MEDKNTPAKGQLQNSVPLHELPSQGTSFDVFPVSVVDASPKPVCSCDSYLLNNEYTVTCQTKEECMKDKAELI